MTEAVWRRLAWVLLAAALVLAYLAALDTPFVYDDKIEVVGNGTIRDLSEWAAIARYNVSRPLLVLSYALDYSRHGLDPRGYHWTNLAIGALSLGAAMLLAEGVLRLYGVARPLPRAVLVALLWGLHPMGTEAITYITGRSESLCALWSFLSLWAWSRALARERGVDEPARPAPGWRLLGLLAFLAAVSTKEVGAVVPAAALLLEVGSASGGLRARLRAVAWAWLLPYAALIGVAAWLRLQHAESFLPREVDRPLAVQLVTQAEAWLRYVALWLLPRGQTIFHHLDDLAPLSPRGVAAVGGWLLLVGAGVAWGRRVPAAGFALAAGALFLLPSSSVVPLKESMAEHRAFQTGFWLLLALAASVPARRERPALAVGLLLALALGGLTQLRHRAWQSEVALWEEATRRRPEVADAWYGLGDAQRFAGELAAARTSFQRALDQDPGHLDAWNNLGIVQASLGDVQGAQQTWLDLLRRSPTYCKAHGNLGVLAQGAADWDEAITEFRTALAYCPENARAHLGLCEIHYGPRRDRERAVFHCEAFLQLAPHSDRAGVVKEWLLELTF